MKTKGTKPRKAAKAKPFANGRYTEAGKKAWIMSSLRRARWPVKWDALKDSYVCDEINPKTGRKNKKYRCAKCANLFSQKEVQIDHVEPVVPVSGFESWDSVIERLFCEGEGFQVLCKACHKEKTAAENRARR